MGQRLVISILDEETNSPVMSIYYHWSAYTDSALSEIKGIVETYTRLLNRNESKNPYSNLITALYQCGATLDVRKDDEPDEINDTKKALANLCGNEGVAFLWALNRNSGLIGLTENQIQTALSLAEGEASLILCKNGELIFNSFDVYCCGDDLSTFIDVYGFDDSKLEEKILKLHHDCSSKHLKMKDAEKEMEKLDFGPNFGIIENEDYVTGIGEKIVWQIDAGNFDCQVPCRMTDCNFALSYSDLIANDGAPYVYVEIA